MATRCQVFVTGKEGTVVLYHHWDGYPRNMLAVIKNAFERVVRQKRDSYKRLFPGQKITREQILEQTYAFWSPFKAASIVCGGDPEGYEVEVVTKRTFNVGLLMDHVHGDVDYIYVIDVDSLDKEWNIVVKKVGWVGDCKRRYDVCGGSLDWVIKQFRADRKKRKDW